MANKISGAVMFSRITPVKRNSGVPPHCVKSYPNRVMRDGDEAGRAGGGRGRTPLSSNLNFHLSDFVASIPISFIREERDRYRDACDGT
ncbi:hypothetical protein EVAR_31169_1 [Eumeta japonica]|uniref:Uncharacterized protein n=1 Tax=Eumeta variegata TaxID=151549 RepID=A0A4C1VZN4_EUMVA|nr:hypothetical protein EVAR_31169_1 [Eumeta japonica]